MRRFPAPGLVAAMFAALLLTACSDDKPNFPVRTYPLGEKAQVGHLIYTVFETQWLTQIHQEPLPRIPESRFFLVRISAVNSGSDDAIVPTTTIENDHGKTYAELSNGEGVPQWTGYLRHVKPGDSVQGNIVFDAPPGHYKLHLSDETGDRLALVDIPLSFGAETPEVALPSEKK
jgi:hypothetical protein